MRVLVVRLAALLEPTRTVVLVAAVGVGVILAVWSRR
jgi:hypothetical protein